MSSARVWLFISYIVSFGAIAGAVAVLFSNYGALMLPFVLSAGCPSSPLLPLSLATAVASSLSPLAHRGHHVSHKP
jgi:hypothetical protein